MMNCNNYFDMTDQGDSFETWQGLRGPAGTTFTPAVSSAGVISWTNNGGLPNPSPVDIRGPQGPQGEPQTPSDAEPLMDGTASAGISTDYARGDHRHPSDYNKAPVIIDTASGAVASFPDGADGLPLHKLTVQIEPVQAGTGDPSPTNIRPIAGWTGCNISHSGEDTSDPDTITTTWQDEAGTVYYGTIDIISGVLSALAAIFDMGDLTYTETSGGIRFDINGGVGSGAQGTPAAFAMCSAYKMYSDAIETISQITLPNNNIVQTGASGARARFYIRDDRYTTPADMKAGLSGVQFLCEMRDPITYQLTPQQVNTLIGVNNIWADCGPVAVEYPADTKLYIQKINAPSDDDMTADTQISSGKYFIVGGTLYLSTTTIPAGDTIIPGTNCQQTNLAEALNALNA